MDGEPRAADVGGGGGSPAGVGPDGSERTFGWGGGAETVGCGCVSSVGWVMRLGTSLAGPS